MDVYEDYLPPNNKKNDESELFNKKRQMLYNNLDELNEMSSTKDKNKTKLSLRKKKNFEYINQFRKDKLKRLNLYCNNNNNSIDYNEIIKQIPNEIIIEFNNSKNKYEFYIKYLSIPDEKDPYFCIRMFVIYQIHIYVNNDITNSSRPSPDLQNYLLKYLVYDYRNENLLQKIKIQNEIIQLFIIWNSYTDDDDTNNVFYEDQFIYFLFDLLDNNIYSIEFKINILILFNTMIKGINTFNKIMEKYEIINKIEKILFEIKKDEQYIYVLSVVDNIIEFFGDHYENITFNNINRNNNKIIIFMKSYEKFILLLKNYYDKYQALYDELKNNKTPLSMDNSLRIFYKIIIKSLKIINDSLFINDNKYYINALISNNISLPLFYKIMEKFSMEYFLAPSNVNINDSNHKLKIINNVYIETTSKFNTKNNLYKKCKVLIYITHILNEIISSISENENEKESDKIIQSIFKNFNFIHFYTNLIKNFVCLGVEPDKYLILRIEELIYNYCEGNKNHFIQIYQNYDLVRELLGINMKYYNEDNFLLLLKFIIYSLELYEPEVTGKLIFNVKIIGIFMKYLEKEYKSEKIYLNEKQRNIFYALNIILDSETYIKCKLNRNLIIQEFANFNSNHIIFQYSINLEREDFEIVNKTLAYLDESDILDNREKEDIFN